MTRNRILLFLVGLGALVLVAGFGGYNYWLNQPVVLEEEVFTRVEPGMTGRQIGERLRQDGVVSSAEEFRWAIWLLRSERDLKVGRFRFEPPLTRRQLVRQLTDGNSEVRRVQILEGWPSWRVYQVLAHRLNYDVSEFERYHEDRQFLESHDIQARSLEGYLFPDTYRISLSKSPGEVLGRLVDRFFEVAHEAELESRAKEHGLTLDEAVRLASIIEREGKLREELPKISAVFHSRLKRGMKLQADPTVLYVYGDFSRVLTRADLEVNSPYNTYEHFGLPPGAISNPGRASLEAAVNPSEDAYLYFFARGDGTHAFSKTLEEHHRSIRQYRE